MLPQEVAKLLTDIWIDANFYLVAIPRKKKQSPRIKSETQQIVITLPMGVKYEIDTKGKKVPKGS